MVLSGTGLRAVKSDENGRFEFTDLPRGNFTLDATKAGFAFPVVVDFSGFPDPAGVRRFAVADGETVERTITLTRGAVIRGRVVDEFGDPISDEEIRVERFVYGPGSSRQLVQHPSTWFTDDRGEYRVYGVLPGEVLVSVRSRQFGASITAGAGGTRDRAETLLPTYRPNTTSLSEALPLRVDGGREYTVDLVGVAGRLVRLSGLVLGSTGKPPIGYRVVLNVNTSSAGTSYDGGALGADGAFSFSNVPPGDYVLQVRQITQTVDGESVSVPISLSQDVAGLQVTMPRGTTVNGSLVWDGTAPRPPAGSEFFLQSAESSRGQGTTRVTVSNAAPAVTRDDGTFQRHGVIGRVIVAPGTPQWAIRSVSYNGRDVTDTGLDTATIDDNGRVVVVMTDRISTLSGTVRDTQRRPVPEHVVVVLPQRPIEGMGATRWTKVVLSDRDGGFIVRNLPAGDYVATAVAKLEAGQEWDPAVQQTLRDAGQRFTLSEGQTLSLNLEVRR